MASNFQVKNFPLGLKITAIFFFLVLVNFAVLIYYIVRQGPAAVEPQPLITLPESATGPGIPESTVDLNTVYSEISQLILLPADEKPTLVNITDVSQLKNQPFFANAQNGDVVLVFSQSKKAYLYRRSIKKLVEVSPITFAVPTVIPTPMPTPLPTSTPQI